MNRRTVAFAVLALALGGCATYGPGYADGSYAGPYNGGYYSAPAGAYGDYYYDRPQVVYDYPDYYYGPYGGYGFGYAAWGFGYDPWLYGSCCYHGWWGDGDADDWHHHHHHHWSGQGPWTHAVSAGREPRGGMSRGDPDRRPPPPRLRQSQRP